MDPAALKGAVDGLKAVVPVHIHGTPVDDVSTAFSSNVSRNGSGRANTTQQIAIAATIVSAPTIGSVLRARSTLRRRSVIAPCALPRSR